MSDMRNPEERLTRLLARLRSSDETIRIHAALRLTGPGIDAAQARLALSEALHDADEPVRKLAAWAMARLAGPTRAAA